MPATDSTGYSVEHSEEDSETEAGTSAGDRTHSIHFTFDLDSSALKVVSSVKQSCWPRKVKFSHRNALKDYDLAKNEPGMDMQQACLQDSIYIWTGSTWSDAVASPDWQARNEEQHMHLSRADSRLHRAMTEGMAPMTEPPPYEGPPASGLTRVGSSGTSTSEASACTTAQRWLSPRCKSRFDVASPEVPPLTVVMLVVGTRGDVQVG